MASTQVSCHCQHPDQQPHQRHVDRGRHCLPVLRQRHGRRDDLQRLGQHRGQRPDRRLLGRQRRLRAGSVTCGGAGTVTLAAANAYTGNTLVTGYGSGYATHINLLLGSSSGTAISGNLTIGNNSTGFRRWSGRRLQNQLDDLIAADNLEHTPPERQPTASVHSHGNNQTIAGLWSTGNVPGNAVVKRTPRCRPRPVSAELTINDYHRRLPAYAGLIRDNWNQNGTVAWSRPGAG